MYRVFYGHLFFFFFQAAAETRLAFMFKTFWWLSPFPSGSNASEGLKKTHTLVKHSPTNPARHLGAERRELHFVISFGLQAARTLAVVQYTYLMQ